MELHGRVVGESSRLRGPGTSHGHLSQVVQHVISVAGEERAGRSGGGSCRRRF